ncbi:PHD finger protein ING2 [Folsomia candida]|uniref:PHD finger protein ING2 n=1 Tax=Folsomia candida TaxID=158441 RepID=A0A226D7E1_FOLCA|nr:PHD finger protein ING2 [Folsomia candida]
MVEDITSRTIITVPDDTRPIRTLAWMIAQNRSHCGIHNQNQQRERTHIFACERQRIEKLICTASHHNFGLHDFADPAKLKSLEPTDGKSKDLLGLIRRTGSPNLSTSTRDVLMQHFPAELSHKIFGILTHYSCIQKHGKNALLKNPELHEPSCTQLQPFVDGTGSLHTDSPIYTGTTMTWEPSTDSLNNSRHSSSGSEFELLDLPEYGDILRTTKQNQECINYILFSEGSTPKMKLRDHPRRKILFTPTSSNPSKKTLRTPDSPFNGCICREDRGGSMIECSAVPKCKNGLWFHYEVPDSPRPACVTVSEEDRQSGTDWLCPWCIGDGINPFPGSMGKATGTLPSRSNMNDVKFSDDISLDIYDSPMRTVDETNDITEAEPNISDEFDQDTEGVHLFTNGSEVFTIDDVIAIENLPPELKNYKRPDSITVPIPYHDFAEIWDFKELRPRPGSEWATLVDKQLAKMNFPCSFNTCNTCRPVKGNEREKLRKELEHNRSFKTHIEQHSKVSGIRQLHNNFLVSSTDAIRKMRSEALLQGTTKWKGFVQAMLDVAKELNTDEKFIDTNNELSDYVRKLSSFIPHSMVLFSPQQIKFASFCDELYIDSTGSVVPKIVDDKGKKKQVLLHVAVGKSSKKDTHTPVPVFEVFSTVGNVAFITPTIMDFVSKVRKFSPSWTPSLVVTDFCLAYLHSASLAISTESLDTYINRKYDLLIGKQRWFTYLPLWSKVGFIGKENTPENTITNGLVEKSFANFKVNFHPKKMFEPDLILAHSKISTGLVTQALIDGRQTRAPKRKRSPSTQNRKKKSTKKVSTGFVANPDFQTARWGKKTDRKTDTFIPKQRAMKVGKSLAGISLLNSRKDVRGKVSGDLTKSSLGITEPAEMSSAIETVTIEDDSVFEQCLDETRSEEELLCLRPDALLNDVVANAIAAIIIGISNLENADKYKLLVSNFIEDTPNGNFVARMSRLPHEASFDKSNGTLLMLAFTNTPKHCVLNSICFSTKEVLQYDSLPDCINEARRTSFFKTLVTALNLHFGLNKQRWTFTLCPCPKQVGNECAIMALGFLKVLVTLGAELTNVDPNNCKVYREEYVVWKFVRRNETS